MPPAIRRMGVALLSLPVRLGESPNDHALLSMSVGYANRHGPAGPPFGQAFKRAAARLRR